MSDQPSKLAEAIGVADCVITLEGLPEAPKSGRWTSAQKAGVAEAVLQYKAGAIRNFAMYLAAEAYPDSGLSEEEVGEWVRAYSGHGQQGLQATNLQHFRRRDFIEGRSESFEMLGLRR